MTQAGLVSPGRGRVLPTLVLAVALGLAFGRFALAGRGDGPTAAPPAAVAAADGDAATTVATLQAQLRSASRNRSTACRRSDAVSEVSIGLNPTEVIASTGSVDPGPQEFPMSSVCDVCGKKPIFGMKLSHSHRRTKRRWNPNIQRVRAVVNGSPKRVNACTSCIKAGKVTKA